jgi:hypothetical protein
MRDSVRQSMADEETGDDEDDHDEGFEPCLDLETEETLDSLATRTKLTDEVRWQAQLGGLYDGTKTVMDASRQHLVDVYPGVSIDEGLGPELLPLGASEREDWLSRLAVVEDAERVVDETVWGTLTESQAESFGACYPTLLSRMTEEVRIELEDLRFKADRKRKRRPNDDEAEEEQVADFPSLPEHVRNMLATLLGIETGATPPPPEQSALPEPGGKRTPTTAQATPGERLAVPALGT